MSNPIILNFRVPVNLRDVFVIERVLPSDRDRIAAKTGQDRDRLEAFQSNVRFIDGTNTLVTQSFEEIAAKADNRFVTVRSEAGEEGQPVAVQIVPIDAIRHLELITDADRQAMKERYEGTDPTKIDALKTRIVYANVDPLTAGNGRANFFQKMFPVDIEQDLRAAQKLGIVDIGNRRFLIGSEIAKAKDLSEAELESLSRKYNLNSEDGELVTSITLRSGDLILSPLPADEVTGQIRRPVPQRTVARRASASGRRAAIK
jgi:hypothetical protein